MRAVPATRSAAAARAAARGSAGMPRAQREVVAGAGRDDGQRRRRPGRRPAAPAWAVPSPPTATTAPAPAATAAAAARSASAASVAVSTSRVEAGAAELGEHVARSPTRARPRPAVGLHQHRDVHPEILAVRSGGRPGRRRRAGWDRCPGPTGAGPAARPRRRRTSWKPCDGRAAGAALVDHAGDLDGDLEQHDHRQRHRQHGERVLRRGDHRGEDDGQEEDPPPALGQHGVAEHADQVERDQHQRQLEADAEGDQHRQHEADVVLRGERDDHAVAGEPQQQPAARRRGRSRPAPRRAANSSVDDATKPTA